jgi:hypothetical protein
MHPLLIAMTIVTVLSAADPGSTTVSRWKDGKDGAFVLIFDDGMPSQLKQAIPEMSKRGIVGTFYLSPGVKWFDAKAWATGGPAQAMAIANHTNTHAGAKNAAEAEADIAQCAKALEGLRPELANSRLISFARPGGVAWKVSDTEQAAILARHNLLKRPASDGRFGGIHLKSAAEMIRFVDQAVQQGSLEWVMFHGIGGDWLSTPLADFTALLDALVAQRDRLWITDTVSAQQYEAERKASSVSVLASTAQAIRLRLDCSLDPVLYNAPLTLITRVPAGWSACSVVQGKRSTAVQAVDGVLRYDAVPGPDEIVLTRR